MKNPNAILPKPQELNETVRNPSQIAEIQRSIIMIEPKFDGSFVYITKDKVTNAVIICTKDGNELSLEPKIQQALVEHFQGQDCLFEAELEPYPWSEAAKVKLNGNLYSGAALPFGIRVVVHDLLPFSEIGGGVTKAGARYNLLCNKAGTRPENVQQKPHVWKKTDAVTICISPCLEVTPSQAAKLFTAGWENGKSAKRVMFSGEPYEGLVGIDPESVHKGGRSNKWKFKPFHSVDVRITGCSKSDKGKTTSYQILGEDIKSGETIKLFTGISPETYQEVLDAQQKYSAVVIEVEALAIKSLAHGNPTLKGIRYDKMTQKAPEIEP